MKIRIVKDDENAGEDDDLDFDHRQRECGDLRTGIVDIVAEGNFEECLIPESIAAELERNGISIDDLTAAILRRTGRLS